ncbi:MAG: ribosome recycling factor [Thermaerobacter sp.]|nr:ribosome recycling factor [Thermaerobacter sp.]
MHDLLSQAQDKMQKSVAVLHEELQTLRAGRATPALVEKLPVEYYGTPTPLQQVAQISAPEPRLLVIQPWDKQLLPLIEKAILKSELGLSPASDGNLIRLQIPQLTEERRKELVRVLHKKAEDEKVAVRNVRRDALEHLKAEQKQAKISEDELRRLQDELQKLTDHAIGEIEQATAAKEKEILSV